MNDSKDIRPMLISKLENMNLRWKPEGESYDIALNNLKDLDEKYLEGLFYLEDDQFVELLDNELDFIPKLLAYRINLINKYGNHISKFMIRNIIEYMDADNYPEVKETKDKLLKKYKKQSSIHPKLMSAFRVEKMKSFTNERNQRINYIIQDSNMENMFSCNLYKCKNEKEIEDLINKFEYRRWLRETMNSYSESTRKYLAKVQFQGIDISKRINEIMRESKSEEEVLKKIREIVGNVED